ncbi:MAG: hypothetical protein DI635_06180 [Pseudoxanthomonas suwonensis]|nr:MAG: hypothetical protein DI635_06180 [Pseudoxanthomonas suwonensis]
MINNEWLTQGIGWTSSAILLATLIRQIVKQQQADAGDDGVSHWLFIGQTLASIGFVAYSILVHNWVFIVTNSLILVTAVIGFVLQRRRKCAASAPERAG